LTWADWSDGPLTKRHPIDQYARDVAAHKVPAGKYHHLACLRHERDRNREARADFPYRLDLAEVDRLVRFASQLRHYKGQWAGQYIRLEPQQVFRLGSIVAWRHGGHVRLDSRSRVGAFSHR
jgi:hypothetical protein